MPKTKLTKLVLNLDDDDMEVIRMLRARLRPGVRLEQVIIDAGVWLFHPLGKTAEIKSKDSRSLPV